MGKRVRIGKEEDMRLHPQSPQNASNDLHPVVYKMAAALLIWFVAAAWLLFGGPGYIDLALAMISVLVGGVLAMLAVLLRTGAKARTTKADSTVSNQNEPGGDAEAHSIVPNRSESAGDKEPFDSWLRGEFSTWTELQKGSTAAVEILLPIAAVAIGITALGIVLDLVRTGGV
jgi:hypothetical protein